MREKWSKNLLKEKTTILKTEQKRSKKGANYLAPLASGLNRRAFLKTSSAITLLAGLTACKPTITAFDDSANLVTDKFEQGQSLEAFSKEQKITLDAVQMQLFPDDGNGPSARDLKAVDYLEWAMSDPQNIEDGDLEFLRKGIGWLDDLANQSQGDPFIKLANQQQDKVLRQIANSNAGENWLAMIIYYITEALTLDPVYGGNPQQIGWLWLEHQPGFPRPIDGKTYRDFA